MPDVIDISRLGSDDRARWEILARGYKTFYETVESDAAFEGTWLRILDDDVVQSSAGSSAIPSRDLTSGSPSELPVSWRRRSLASGP